MVIEILGQILGFVGAFFNILSYQFKSHRNIVLCQLAGSSFFAVSYLLLGTYTGGLLNGVGILRCIVYSNKDKFRANHAGWLVFFIGLYLTMYTLSFTVFGTPFDLSHALLEILPVLGMTSSHVALRMTEGRHIRMLAFLASPMWLVYNIITVSMGAILCEVFVLISVVIGVVRHDIKKNTHQVDIER